MLLIYQYFCLVFLLVNTKRRRISKNQRKWMSYIGSYIVWDAFNYYTLLQPRTSVVPLFLLRQATRRHRNRLLLRLASRLILNPSSTRWATTHPRLRPRTPHFTCKWTGNFMVRKRRIASIGQGRCAASAPLSEDAKSPEESFLVFPEIGKAYRYCYSPSSLLPYSRLQTKLIKFASLYIGNNDNCVWNNI